MNRYDFDDLYAKATDLVTRDIRGATPDHFEDAARTFAKYDEPPHTPNTALAVVSGSLMGMVTYRPDPALMAVYAAYGFEWATDREVRP